MPKVSVILTSYNKPNLVREAIESVITQTYRDWELLLMDDQSNPDMVDVYRDYWNHPQIILYKDAFDEATRKDRVRYAVLANTGMHIARGEYITYLCDDDLFMPNRLAAMTAALDADPNIHVVYGTQHVTEGDKVVLVRPADRVLDRAYSIVDHSSVMHRKSTGLAVGGWDESPEHWRCADAIFWCRLTDNGYKFYPVAELTDVHRFNPGSVSGQMDRGLW